MSGWCGLGDYSSVVGLDLRLVSLIVCVLLVYLRYNFNTGAITRARRGFGSRRWCGMRDGLHGSCEQPVIKCFFLSLLSM